MYLPAEYRLSESLISLALLLRDIMKNISKNIMEARVAVKFLNCLRNVIEYSNARNDKDLFFTITEELCLLLKDVWG